MNIDQRAKAWNLAVFMQGENIVLIHDEEEMKHFVDLMQYHRIDCFSHQKGCEQWRHYGPFFSLITVLQNRHLISEGFDGKTLYVEFQGDKDEINMGAFDDQTRKWYGENGSTAHAYRILRGFYEGALNAFTQKNGAGMGDDARELMERLKVDPTTQECIDLFIKQKPFSVDDIDDRKSD